MTEPTHADMVRNAVKAVAEHAKSAVLEPQLVLCIGIVCGAALRSVSLDEGLEDWEARRHD